MADFEKALIVKTPALPRPKRTHAEQRLSQLRTGVTTS
jgi:hypothetical protein